MAAMTSMKCKCGKDYLARTADIKRGWGRSCSKSCAKLKGAKMDRPATKREPKEKPECRECGSNGWVGEDGLCDLCSYHNEPQMGWDDHKDAW